MKSIRWLHWLEENSGIDARIVKLGQRGDTIVEVMIVLAVLGLALSISYATANRSLLNTRQASENAQAAEYLQSQIELLRTMVGNPATVNGSANPDYIFKSSPTTLFCVIDSSGVPHAVNTSASSPNSACQVDAIPYNLAISFNATGNDTFTAVANWPDVLGEGQDTVTLSYRIYPYSAGMASESSPTPTPVPTPTPTPTPPAPTCPSGQTGTPPDCQSPPLKNAPSNVSWYNHGDDATCIPTSNCQRTANYSVLANGDATVLAFDYTKNNVLHPGESQPAPGETGLELKICYTQRYSSSVDIDVGNQREYTDYVLSPATPGNHPDSDDCSYPYTGTNLPITTPNNGNTSLTLTLNSGTLELHNITIYTAQ